VPVVDLLPTYPVGLRVTSLFSVFCFSYSDKDDEEEAENRTENEIEKNKQVRCT